MENKVKRKKVNVILDVWIEDDNTLIDPTDAIKITVESTEPDHVEVTGFKEVASKVYDND